MSSIHRLLLAGVASALLLAHVAAAANPSGTGQPNAECDESPSSPGHASDSPGSAFNEDSTSHAHYAGEPGTASEAHAGSEHAVSQYDVACAQQP
jgi:hypothetical protein